MLYFNRLGRWLLGVSSVLGLSSVAVLGGVLGPLFMSFLTRFLIFRGGSRPTFIFFYSFFDFLYPPMGAGGDRFAIFLTN